MNDLERIAARQISAHLERAAVGASLPIMASSDLSDTLELFIPEILRRTYPEWEKESIDGFFFSRAIKRTDSAAELAGTCILISDQTVTPFKFDFNVTNGKLRPMQIRLGERGGGPLGISGPGCNSREAHALLAGLDARLDRVDWAYDIALG